jgi:hypothetical protein
MLISVMGPVLVAAQTSQTQPLEQFSWYTKKIPFYLQTVSAPGADQGVLDAMQIWVQSQEWFISTYENGQGAPYEFVQVDQATATSSGIVITFNQTQTSADVYHTYYRYYWDSGGDFSRITVTNSIILTFHDGSPLSLTNFRASALQQLGVGLGLDFTTFSASDLMNKNEQNVLSPSTLNLYALYLLSKTISHNSQPFSPISLPSGIPYSAAPAVPVPEFTTPSIMVMLMVGLSLLVIRRRRS